MNCGFKGTSQEPGLSIRIPLSILINGYKINVITDLSAFGTTSNKLKRQDSMNSPYLPLCWLSLGCHQKKAQSSQQLD